MAGAAEHRTTALSVNVNKVAQLRNTRHLGLPSVVHAATLCLQAGAQGITVHPRPDERHMRAHDVHDMAALLKAWPQAEFNIEGNPFQNLMPFVRQARPHQCTFVPDSEGQFTSDHGWDLAADGARLRPLIDECHALGVRVSLFMDAEPGAMAAARAVGADRVELYTEPYAAAWAAERAAERAAESASEPASERASERAPERAPECAAAQAPERGADPAPEWADRLAPPHGAVRQGGQLARFAAAAAAAQNQGLGVNAGHDLNRANLTAFLRAVPGVLEVSIGHALIADALEFGLPDTVRAYLRCIHAAQAAP